MRSFRGLVITAALCFSMSSVAAQSAETPGKGPAQATPCTPGPNCNAAQQASQRTEFYNKLLQGSAREQASVKATNFTGVQPSAAFWAALAASTGALAAIFGFSGSGSASP